MRTQQRILDLVQHIGLLAVIRGPSKDVTLRMVDALVEGGVNGIEITYTTPRAEEIVKQLYKSYDEDILLGMGTLTRPDQALRARDAGASFLVSPHCEENLATAMVETNLLTILGALTPSEVQRARRLGADVVKIFPASLGGPGYIKSLRGPYPDLLCMPTGGVTLENLPEWFDAGVIAVGAGSALCPRSWAIEGRFEAITARARAFVKAVHAARARA